MKISIIVPVYNGEKYIRRCIDSILSQTFSDIEILIINDGSTDSSEQIAKEYTQKHDNILLINKKNAGLPQSRKTGVENASGEYIGFVDVDDWIEPDMFNQLYNGCINNDADISCCGFWWDYETSKELSNKSDDSVHLLNGISAFEKLHTRKSIFQYAWNKLYKKELFEGVVFPTGNFVGEDYYIVTQLLGKSKKVAWIPNAYYHYIQSKNSMSRGGYTDNYLIAYKNYRNISQNLIKQFPAQKSYIENYCLTEYASFIVAMGKNNKYNHEMIQQIVSYARSHKKQYLHADYIDTKFKLSVKAICYNYRILIKGYQLIGRLKRK